jgi:DNA-binding transcriptional ArsR family regulator
MRRGSQPISAVCAEIGEDGGAATSVKRADIRRRILRSQAVKIHGHQIHALMRICRHGYIGPMDPFTVLAEPTRRRILEQLAPGPCTVNSLAERLTLSQPTASKHLRVLREAGFVSVRAEAQKRWYVLNPAPLQQVDAWIGRYRAYWSGQLDALEAHLDETS